jgi:hypothetical protein
MVAGVTACDSGNAPAPLRGEFVPTRVNERYSRNWFFKVLVALLAIAIIVPASTSAQRISVMPFGGHLWIGPVLRHDTHLSDTYTISSSHEELVLTGGNLYGADLGLWRVRGWQVYLDGGYTWSSLHYHYDASVANAQNPGAPATMSRDRKDVAKILALGAGLQRHFDFLSLGVIPKLGLGFTQLQLMKRDEFCPFADCSDRWDLRYNVPGVVLGFDLRVPSASPVSVGLSAKAGVGRVDTSGFEDNPPDISFPYEAPASRWLRTGQVVLGVVIEL